LETPPEFLEFILKKIMRAGRFFNLASAEIAEKDGGFWKEATDSVAF